ncbi:MAG: hypothetical protein K2L84_06385 [Muribaculaceae bacterium]|nr:hypothetical protein [Muribaculaceae bacterium]
MNLIKRIALVGITAVVSLCAAANNDTYYSKMTVTAAPTGTGKVYVSASSADTPDYNSTSTASNTSSSSGKHTYYLYAKAEPGYQFKNWTTSTGSQVSTSESFTQTIATSDDNKSEATAATAEYIANFVERTRAVTATTSVGTVTVTPKENKIGDEVTVTFTPPTYGGNEYVPDLALDFDGCYDSEGNLISTEQSFTIKAEKMMDLTGSFSMTPRVTKAKGYYRVLSCYNAPIRVSGNAPISINASSTSAVSVHADITNIKNPLGHSIGRDDTKALNRNFYDDPAAILYMEGTLNSSNSASYKVGNTVLDNVSMTAQGISLFDVIKFTTSFSTPAVTLKWAAQSGHYKLVASIVTIKTLWDSNINKNNDVVKIGRDTSDDFNSNCTLQPIDEENADRFWFGACPTEEMYFDGGYWTSMYASFPFECYEPDGVEAYIINEFKTDGEENLLVLSRIENGIVPAATPVLLKCRQWTDTSEYFDLTKKKPLAPQNRLIPLLPDDERIDATVAEGNLLSGTYNLLNGVPAADWTNVESYIPDKYDASKHRIFSVNAEGRVGFYKQPAGYKFWVENPNEITEMSLRPNRAYLDLSKLPSATLQGAPFRIISEDEAAGIDNIIVKPEAPVREGIYDLYGRRVEHMIPGNIYIVNGVKTLAR